MDIGAFFLQLTGPGWFAQWIGILAMLLSFIGYQARNSHRIFFFQILTNGIWAFHLALIGAWAAAALNVCGLVRSLFLYYDDRKWANGPAAIGGITFLMVSAGVAGWILGDGGWVPILPILAMAIGTPLLFTRKDSIVRRAQFFLISPLWLINNCLIGSVGGVFCEIGNMISVGSSILRYRKAENQRSEG